jgi:hypothetical protein
MNRENTPFVFTLIMVKHIANIYTHSGDLALLCKGRLITSFSSDILSAAESINLVDETPFILDLLERVEVPITAFDASMVVGLADTLRSAPISKNAAICFGIMGTGRDL